MPRETTEIYLPGFAAHYPGLPPNFEAVTEYLPPSVVTAEGLDLDFSLLLLFDRLVIDSFVLDYLDATKFEFLEPMTKSLSILKAEGYVRVIDSADLLARNGSQIDTAVDRNLVRPDQWLPTISSQIRAWEREREGLRLRLGRHAEKDAARMSLGVYCFVMSHFGVVNEAEVSRLERLLHSQKTSRTRQELQELRELIRPYLYHTFANIALESSTGVPFLDWDCLSPIYRAHFENVPVVFRQPSRRIEAGSRVKELFSVALPELRPTQPSEFLKAVRHPAIESFRRRIKEAVEGGETFDYSFGRREFLELTRSSIKLGKLRKIVAWAGRAVGLVPGGSLFSVPVEEGVDYLAERKLVGNRRWLYCLIDAVQSGQGHAGDASVPREQVGAEDRQGADSNVE